jgi:hypothetical protein
MYSYDSPGTQRTRSEFTEFDLMDDEPSELVTDMLLLAGMDAVVATHRKRRSDTATGRPESSGEFARHMKDKFVLRCPQKRTEGGNRTTTHEPNVATPDNATINATVNRNFDVDRTDAGTTEANTDQIMEAFQKEVQITETNIAPEPNPDASLVNMLESDNGIDLLRELKGKYQDDPTFKSIIEKPKEFRNFEVKNDLIYLKQDEKSLLCVPKIIINGRNVHEIIISEAHSILAHLGANKTLNYLWDHIWWKDMVSDTKSY